jgi:hypothetical protein
MVIGMIVGVARSSRAVIMSTSCNNQGFHQGSSSKSAFSSSISRYITYQSPARHVNYLAATSTNGESEDEHHDLGSTIQSRRHEEVVLAEPPGPVSAQIVLREDSQTEGREDRTVDADAEVAKSPCERVRPRAMGTEEA